MNGSKRSDVEMIDVILKVAHNDSRIRAVIMTGSRANPKIPKDCFQDYDITYLVEDLPSFLCDHSWIDVFGERIVLQIPENAILLPPRNDGSFNYLMLFTDGNRIDLTLIPMEKRNALITDDELTIVLLDKDGVLPPFPPPNDEIYHVKPPDKMRYDECCNEFWWVLQNVAKGIKRDELPYAMKMFGFSRDMLDQIISWWIGIQYDFGVSTGKFGRYFKRFLGVPYWEMYCNTYSDGNYENLWKSIFTACELFRTLAIEVGKHFNYVYPFSDDAKMMEYLTSLEVGSQRRYQKPQ